MPEQVPEGSAAWIPIPHALFDCPAGIVFADDLGRPDGCVHLLHLWVYCRQTYGDGDWRFAEHGWQRIIEKASRWRGTRGALVTAALATGWLIQEKSGVRVAKWTEVVHGHWQSPLPSEPIVVPGNSAPKGRRTSADRMRDKRERDAAAKIVTPKVEPESNNVTPPVAPVDGAVTTSDGQRVHGEKTTTNTETAKDQVPFAKPAEASSSDVTLPVTVTPSDPSPSQPPVTSPAPPDSSPSPTPPNLSTAPAPSKPPVARASAAPETQLGLLGATTPANGAADAPRAKGGRKVKAEDDGLPPDWQAQGIAYRDAYNTTFPAGMGNVPLGRLFNSYKGALKARSPADLLKSLKALSADNFGGRDLDIYATLTEKWVAKGLNLSARPSTAQVPRKSLNGGMTADTSAGWDAGRKPGERIKPEIVYE